ncbi:Hypothetical predicted protein [Podarcis lilfordi]|uniref:Uncharacterized protein n=1 Tax=Podarcis lilfordi TaxID=74358 RepID=A0AA35PD90_9SAUR|nr:Hypothetical predicted protein [Podarcis lilfordi]
MYNNKLSQGVGIQYNIPALAICGSWASTGPSNTAQKSRKGGKVIDADFTMRIPLKLRTDIILLRRSTFGLILCNSFGSGEEIARSQPVAP